MKNYVKRATRVRSKLRAVSDRPRLTVIRTNEHMWAQIIDDVKAVTIAAVSDKSLKLKGTKTERASAVGEAVAKAALEKKVKQVVFDRGAYRYHGRIKAVAEAARKAGLEF